MTSFPARLFKTLNREGSTIVGSLIGMVIETLLKEGMTPYEIGEQFSALTETLVEYSHSKEAIRYIAAHDQLREAVSERFKQEIEEGDEEAEGDEDSSYDFFCGYDFFRDCEQ